MKHKQKLVMTLIISLIAFGLGCSREGEKQPETSMQERVFALQGAPEFSIYNLEGKKVKSSDLKGKVLVLHFWATWCYYCRKEIPHLNALYKQYKDQGLNVLAVSLDQQGAPVVRALRRKMEMNYPIAIGTSEMSADFGYIRGLPTTFIITPSWQIYRRHGGYVPKEVIERDIKELLKKKS